MSTEYVYAKPGLSAWSHFSFPQLFVITIVPVLDVGKLRRGKLVNG